MTSILPLPRNDLAEQAAEPTTIEALPSPPYLSKSRRLRIVTFSVVGLPAYL